MTKKNNTEKEIKSFLKFVDFIQRITGLPNCRHSKGWIKKDGRCWNCGKQVYININIGRLHIVFDRTGKKEGDNNA